MFQSRTSHVFLRAATATAGLFALALPLACRATDKPHATEPPAGAYRYEVSETTAPGTYHIVPAFEDIDLVALVGPADAERTVLDRGEEWSFDAETHALEIGVAIPEGRSVVVWGERAVPWRWKSTGPMAQGSVRALFDDRAGERGRDFDANEAEGSIAILRAELCEPGVQYFVIYQLPGDPAEPQRTTGVSFGNHGDQAAIRRFLGLPDNPETPATGTAASARTNVIALGSEIDGEVRVLLGERLLEEGVGYTVDREAGEITILDPAFGEPGTGYFLTAGNLALGNMSLTPRMQELLEQ